MRHLHGRVAAVTGAASGIGRQLAIRLAAEGTHLALADLDTEGLGETARLAGDGVRITTHELDVAQRDAVFDWARAVVADHGKVNLIINNAGVAVAGTVERLNSRDFEWLMAINFWGVVHGTQAFLPHLKDAGEGQVVNMSSIFGVVTLPGQSPYHASKFAVRGFTESLRQELDLLDCGVSATCVHPGGIKTPIARRARTDPSVSELGIDPDTAATEFEKMFITPPERAAELIVAGIRRDARRVLVGRDAVILDKLARLMPEGLARRLPDMMRKQQRRRRRPTAAEGDR